MTDHADNRQQQPTAASRPQDATAPAEHVVRRMLLRRGYAIAPEDALCVAETLQALFQADPPARPPSRPAARPRRRPQARAAGCEPLFPDEDTKDA